jgi:CBS domain-containing protein
MSSPVITTGPDDSADSAWSRMQQERVRHLAVMEGSRLSGIVSDRDLGGRHGEQTRSGRSVRELMTPNVATAEPDMTLRRAANLMRGRLLGSLPVVDNGRVIGIVTATDVLDELGRGATRPALRAQRRSARLPPAAARAAAREAEKPPPAQPSVRRGQRAAVEVTGRNTPELGRDRVRQPDSPQRAPMPAYIRATGTKVDRADRDYIRRKLGRKLGKFSDDVKRVSVRIEDINGPRGGVDKRCRIKVVLRGLPSVVVEEKDAALQGAIDRALERAAQTVSRHLERRRQKLRLPG